MSVFPGIRGSASAQKGIFFLSVPFYMQEGVIESMERREESRIAPVASSQERQKRFIFVCLLVSHAAGYTETFMHERAGRVRVHVHVYSLRILRRSMRFVEGSHIPSFKFGAGIPRFSFGRVAPCFMAVCRVPRILLKFVRLWLFKFCRRVVHSCRF